MSLESALIRSFDVCGSLAGMIALAPAYAITSAVIFAVDGGPILYRQSCFGKDGKHFEMYKFRTMEVDFPAVSRVHLNETGISPRYTKTGRFLRCTKINELPQLYNILKGDMSFVGPRPCLDNNDPDDPHGMRLNEARMREGISSIRPGLTGYTQLAGGELPLEEMMALDRNYLSCSNPIREFSRLLTETIKYIANYRNHSTG